jgi:hypothetical protein
MADDHSQRPYRGNETPARGPSGGTSGSDPLAELARLIGQNDPFSEFGRVGGRRAPAPPAAPAPHTAPPPAPSAPIYGSADFARQPYGSAPLSDAGDLYHVDQTPGQHVPEYEVPGYGAPGYEASGFPVSPAGAYEQDPFPADAQQRGMDDDYYDDVPPNRRRIGILAIAGVFALAVIGTAGAFGYRAIFGSSSVSSPPPVIKAESAPSKIVPAAASKDAQASKITERVNDRGQGEKLVSREEQPVAVTTTGNVFPPQGQNAATLPGIGPQLGSGVVGSDPKRVRTISIKPDQQSDALPAPQAEPAPQQPRVVSTTRPQAPAPTPAPAPARTNNPPQSIAEAVAEPEPARAPAPRAAPARAEAPAHSPAPANAPLSLNPNAAPAPRSAAPQRTAAAAAPAAVTGSAGSYAVQVSAQRSEEEAQAAFRSLQGKFPGQLGNRQSFIKRVDLGEKGIYFRAMVGPFADSGQASTLCASLKAAGGSCLVQKN